MHRIFTLFALIVFACAGCYGATEKKENKTLVKGPPPAKHEGWWCEEHGVPEHLCSQCSEEVAAKYKKEGKWCKLHDRAEEQCFICDPERYKKYEAMYEAKYNGKKPPRPPESEFKK
jgi:hypothetical protein